MNFIKEYFSDPDYVETVRRSIFRQCLEGCSPWSARLYESVCLEAILLILVKSIVFPFERFVDCRSFSAKIKANNVRKIIDIVKKIEDFVKEKREHVSKYLHAFRWPYSAVGKDNNDQHVFSPDENLNGTAKNVFHCISLELRCRRLEQFYRLTSDSRSPKSLYAKRQACKKHTKVYLCYEEYHIGVLR